MNPCEPPAAGATPNRFAVLGGAVLITSLAVAMACALPPSAVLAAALVLCLLAPAIGDLIAGEFDPFEPRNLFCAVTLMDVGLSVGYASLAAPHWLTRDEFETLLPIALACELGSLLLFYAGYFSEYGEAAALALPPLNAPWRRGRVLFTIAIIFSIGAAAYIALLSSAGGLTGFMSLLTNVSSAESGKFYLLLPATWFPLIATLICYAWARESEDGLYYILSYLSLAATLAIQLTLGWRGALPRTIFGFWFVARRIKPRRRPRLAAASRAALAAAVLVVLFGAATALRSFTAVGADSAPQFVFQSSQAWLSHSGGPSGAFKAVAVRFDMIESLEVIIEKTGTVVPFENGRTFLDLLTMSVPRAFWARKPFNIAVQFADKFLGSPVGDLGDMSPTMTAPGELYWNFGWAGVVIGMALAGIMARGFYGYLRRCGGPSGAIIYFPLYLFVVSFSEGDFAFGGIMLAAMLVPGIAAHLLLADPQGADTRICP